MSRKSKSDQMIDEHISRAMFTLRKSEGTAEEADALWEIPVEKATGDEWYLQGTSSYTGSRKNTDQKKENKSNSVIRRFSRSEFYRMVMASAAAVLLIAGISYYQYFIRVDATVCLDINPSVTLSENRVGRVVSAEANNSDAESVLSEAEPKGKKTDEAVEDILDLMVEQGYITDEDSTVLVSVECGSSARTEMKIKEMTELVGRCIEHDGTEGSVFSQTLSMNDEVRKFAREQSVSAGKAALVLHLADEHPELDAGELASLPMKELVSYLHGQNVDLRDVIDYRGEDLDVRWQKEAEEKQQSNPGTSGAENGSADNRSREENTASGNNNEANAGTGSANSSSPAGNAADANEREAQSGTEAANGAANGQAGTNASNNQAGTDAANNQAGTNAANDQGSADVPGTAHDQNGTSAANNRSDMNGAGQATGSGQANVSNETNGQGRADSPNQANGQAGTNNRTVSDNQNTPAFRENAARERS